MAWLTAIPVIGKVLNGVLGLVDEAVEDKDEANRLKAQLTNVFQNADLTKFTVLVQAQASIITAEANGQSWLQRNWRPLLMLIFMVIISNNYIVHPYIALFSGSSIELDVPDQMWSLLKIGVGGYVVGRSGEKITQLWKVKS